ncbi:MAG: MltA domain-containing protein, partial [Leptospirales bacterium]
MLRTLSVNFVWISGATIYLAVASPALDSHDRGIDSDRAENQGSLVELSPGEIAALDFNDDGDPKTSGANTAAVTKPHRKTATPDSIEAALHNSLEYYLELPTETLFRFGPRPADVYSVREMIASCSLFLKIVRTPDAKRRERGLRRRFRVFESRNAAGATHYTGYYTPRLIGSRRPRAPADVPVHGPPRDLVRVDPGRFVSEYSGPPIHGRVHKGRLIQYFTQSEILFTRAVAENQPLFYLNAADYYHLQLQGGALIKLEPDSDASTGAPKSDESQAADYPSAVYYEYAADNGRDFQS